MEAHFLDLIDQLISSVCRDQEPVVQRRPVDECDCVFLFIGIFLVVLLFYDSFCILDQHNRLRCLL